MAGPAAVFEARPPSPEAAEPPGPGFLGSIGPGFRMARSGPDYGYNQVRYEEGPLAEIRREAAKRGFRGQPMVSGVTSPYQVTLSLDEVADNGIDQLLAWYQAERRRDPKLLPDYAPLTDRRALREWALGRRRADMAKAEEDLRGGSTAGQLVGALGAGVIDPINFFPVGGAGARGVSMARQILNVAGREAAANVGLTLALEPATQQDAKALGVERGLGQVATEVALAGVTGGVIGGGVKAGQIGVGALLARRRAAGTAEDRAAVEAFRNSVPEANWTPEERAAVDLLERTSDLAESSPFEAHAAGDAAHVDGVGEAFRRALGEDAPPRDVPRVTPPPPVVRSHAAAGVAPAGALRAPAREQLKARIRGVESSGDDRAKNPKSTATGRYQFTMPTWLALYERRYGKSGTATARWAKRYDANLQEVLMDDLVADNARRLRDAGESETASNLYLLHFAGPDGLKVLKARADTPVARLLKPDAIAANKFLKGMTAADLRAWADRKMRTAGEAPPPQRSTADEAAPEALPELPDIDRPVIAAADFEARADWLDGADRPMLRAELFGTPEEHARMQLAAWAERDAAEGFARVVDDPPPPSAPVAVRDRPAAVRRSGRQDLMQAIAAAGGIVDNEGHDLVKGRGIPKFQLGAGAIVRRKGTKGARSIDALGEHLWEQGWFGPPETAPRPREAQVLELIERGAREKVYRPDEAADAAQAGAVRAAPDEEEVRWELRETAREGGLELDEATMDDALMRRARGEPVEDAVASAVQAAAYRGADAPAGMERFSDPDGEGIAAQIDSLEHDLRMAAEEGLEGSYRFDEEGDELSLAELLDTADEDLHMAETLRGCMAPVREAAE